MCPYLPNELWLEVFRWAADTPTGVYASSYSPFCDSPAKGDEGVSLSIRRSLVLVCRLWHSLTTELLYRDLQIRQGKCQSVLCEVLSNVEGYGRMVRRAVLPYDSTVTNCYATAPATSVEILKACSQLEVLIRPRTYQYAMRTLTFEFDAEAVKLPSLRRLALWTSKRVK